VKVWTNRKYGRPLSLAKKSKVCRSRPLASCDIVPCGKQGAGSKSAGDFKGDWTTMDLGRWLLQLGVHMLLGKFELKPKSWPQDIYRESLAQPGLAMSFSAVIMKIFETFHFIAFCF